LALQWHPQWALSVWAWPPLNLRTSDAVRGATLPNTERVAFRAFSFWSNVDTKPQNEIPDSCTGSQGQHRGTYKFHLKLHRVAVGNEPHASPKKKVLQFQKAKRRVRFILYIDRHNVRIQARASPGMVQWRRHRGRRLRKLSGLSVEQVYHLTKLVDGFNRVRVGGL
jgi:hypothetical protein